MARGWESKAVADQIEDAEDRLDGRIESQVNVSPEMRARLERLQSLKLSRSRTITQLEHATNPAYREVLSRALSAIEIEMEELKETTSINE